MAAGSRLIMDFSFLEMYLRNHNDVIDTSIQKGFLPIYQVRILNSLSAIMEDALTNQ